MQRRSWRRRAARSAGVVLAALLLGSALCGCFAPEKDTHPNQVLTKRRALFKQYTRTMEPIGLVASGRKPYQPDEFLSDVRDLDKLADKPWQFFTPDGNYPPTRAKPEVWSEPQKFQAAQDDYRAKVRALLRVAELGQRDAIAPAVDAVGASCKACHNHFRNE